MQTITAQELKEKMEVGTALTLVDLQQPEGYAHRHIPQAVHMTPSDTCGDECVALLRDKDALVVLYGEFDELGKGGAVAEVLDTAGYTQVYRLAGGMMGWMEAGFSVEHGRES